MVCANHGLASGAQLVSQFVEEEKEGNHGGMNWKENCRGGEGGCALSHVGKNVLSVTFFRSVLRGVKGIRSSSEFEISRALGDSTRVGGRSQRWPSVKILHHFCKVNSDASSPPSSSHFRQTRKATRFPPRRLDVSPSPLWNFTFPCARVCVYIGSIRAERRRYLRGVRSFSSFYSLNGRISGCFNLLSKKQRRGYKCMNENWKIRSKILGLFHRASSISNSARNSAVAL